MSSEREARSDELLVGGISHKDELPKGEEFLEVNAYLVMGECQGNDLLLLAGAFRIGGKESGNWRVADGMVMQTTFMTIPHSQQGRMQDNDFIGNCLDPIECFSDFQVMRETDRITWKVGNRRYVSRPPYWEIKGEHLGVDINLTMGGLGPAIRYLGPWADLAVSGQAGYDQPCWAEGTITAGGKVHTLGKGFAVHEQLTMGKNWDLVPLLRKDPYNWIWCLSERVQVFIFTLPGLGVASGVVLFDGQAFPFDQSEVSLDELEWWIDPKTDMHIPIRWHVNMNSAGGVMDMNVAAGGRGIFCYLKRSGHTMHYGFLARSNGRFFLPDGCSVIVQDMQTYVERGRCTMTLEP